MLKIPQSMYGKGPKNNPAPAKGWDTSGEHAYGDSQLRILKQAASPEPLVKQKRLVSLTALELRKK